MNCGVLSPWVRRVVTLDPLTSTSGWWMSSPLAFDTTQLWSPVLPSTAKSPMTLTRSPTAMALSALQQPNDPLRLKGAPPDHLFTP